MPALEHLRSPESAAPALSVQLWDSASTATPLPPPFWQMDDEDAPNAAWTYRDRVLGIACQKGVDTLDRAWQLPGTLLSAAASKVRRERLDQDPA
jgi:hypothetical protein